MLIASGPFGENSGDTYLFHLGDGRDTIVEYGTADHDHHLNHAAADTVLFGPGILPTDILRSRTDDHLVFSLNAEDHLVLQDWFVSDLSRIERFGFDNGSVWSLDDVLAQEVFYDGTSGDDSLTGWNGWDHLRGFAGHDTLLGTWGSDWLDGGTGDDVMEGGADNDTYVVDSALDVVTDLADGGTDTVRSSLTWTLGDHIEHLTLTGSAALSGFGNALDNALTGNAAANRLEGMAGADTLDGGAGIDTMVGGAGDDTYVVEVSGDRAIERLAGDGVDTVLSSATAFTLEANVENLILAGSASISGAGNTLANVITGNTGHNLLSGEEGNDTLLGGAGSDSLYGGAGADSLVGGTGDDVYRVGAITDTVVENADEGVDTVEAHVSWTLGEHIENVVLGGATHLSATGNALANRITGNDGYNLLTGNAGNDTIDGGIGADTMVGGTGDDAYWVNSSADVVTELVGEGTDLVFSTAKTFTLGANVEHLTLQGTGSISATGNALANTMTGNAGDNTLDGGQGDDQLLGGAGNDSLLGNAGNDTMAGGAGSDFYRVGSASDVVIELADEGLGDTVEAWVHYTLGAHVEHLTLGSTQAINGTGNGLNNTLTGNSARNTLNGGTGNDTYVMGRGSNADTLRDSDATAGNLDTLSFTAGIATDQLWFRALGNDLEVTIIGTSDKATVKDWYLGSQNHLEQFRTADGKTLLDSAVDNLVTAMAGFAPPAAGQTTLPVNYQSSLSSVISANWQ